MGAPAIDALASAIVAHVRAVRETAAASPAGGGPAWDALLQYYRLAPFDPRERAAVIQYLRLTRGATPGEVRMVLAGLVAWAMGEASRLAQDPCLAPELPRLRAWLDTLVDGETREYERSIGIVPHPLQRKLRRPPPRRASARSSRTRSRPPRRSPGRT